MTVAAPALPTYCSGPVQNCSVRPACVGGWAEAPPNTPRAVPKTPRQPLCGLGANRSRRSTGGRRPDPSRGLTAAGPPGVVPLRGAANVRRLLLASTVLDRACRCAGLPPRRLPLRGAWHRACSVCCCPGPLLHGLAALLR